MAGDPRAWEPCDLDGYEARRQQMLAAVGPEMALWACVVYEAGQCLERKIPGCTRKQREEEIVKARRWFQSDSKDPGSYLWVCGVLGVRPEAYRDKYRHKLQRDAGNASTKGRIRTAA